jgi:UDP-N-acetylmuramoyl-L-alanyl-D-glutamate--2,6-diaminopimelate ligase
VATIHEIIELVQPETVRNPREVEISSVACHPSGVSGPGCLFACINEYLQYNKWETWGSHLEELSRLDLAAVVVPEPIEGLDATQLVTVHPRRALGLIARLLAGAPDEEMDVYGVTGTNGKTTTTRLLAHMLGRMGTPCGSIGTLGIGLEAVFDQPGTYTTPLAPDVWRTLSRMRKAGASAVAMEVSSHGLELERVEGIHFAGSILTNVERDHLDFHGTQAAYAEAKRKLFGMVRKGGCCVLNKQSPYCEAFARTSTGEVVTYGPSGSGADLVLERLDLRPDRSLFSVCFRGESWGLQTRLVGRFQVENIMAAIALLAALGHSGESIAGALASFPSVCGRMERFTLPGGATAIVDYAHNPDGLKNVLENARLLCRGRLHVVFGCGGDRDKGKRPIMGELASRIADVVWITSDNPRTEDPVSIIEDTLAGCLPADVNLRTEPDRKKAIAGACAEAHPDDVVVIAGKGHEDYQIIGVTKFPFSDQEVLRGLGAR